MDHASYQSPFSWRYGSPAMREIWSLSNTRLLWRQIWVALAEAQLEAGLVSEAQLEELRENAANLDLKRTAELERELGHDLMAELQVFADQCPRAGGILHLGATSMDIKDNAVILQQKAGLDLLLQSIRDLLKEYARQIRDTADWPVLGFTHLQPAEPTTFGYRLALTAQDLWHSYQELESFAAGLRGKGFAGAVGTSAAFKTLLGSAGANAFQKRLSGTLAMEFFPVVSQTYPRLQDYRLLCLLAGTAAGLHKLAFDIRILQSPLIGEAAEPFRENQIGSSAMPFKRNPVQSEKLNSLARYLSQLPRIAWDNAANSLLERTLDDSANQRIILPEAFLALDELLSTALTILSGLQLNRQAAEDNLHEFGVFSGTEKVLMLACRAGADRQLIYHRLRELSLQAWAAIRDGHANPLAELAAGDSLLGQYLSPAEIQNALAVDGYLGDAASRAAAFADLLDGVLDPQQ